MTPPAASRPDDSTGEDDLVRSRYQAPLARGVRRVLVLVLAMGGGSLASLPSASGQGTWTPTMTTGAPSGRYGHTAVWTGSKMIVWGGFDGSSNLDTGASYDPATDAWTATSTTNAPTARGGHTAVWTGSKMIVWGGLSAGVWANTGGIYDPATDTWTATSTANAPEGRQSVTAVWAGSKMIVWGGWTPASSFVNTGGTYDPVTYSWAATSTTNAPEPRYDHTAVSTGSKMIVWGGVVAASLYTNTGGMYDPATDTWTATSPTNAPTARSTPTAVWTGSKMIVWGGYPTSNTGGVYHPQPPPPPPPTDFYTVTPCRLVDTRYADGPALGARSIRTFPVTGGACGVPSTAVAVSVNLTAVGSTAVGHLTLFPADAPGPPLASHLNFSADQTRANNAIVRLAADGTGTISVKNGSGGTVHFVLDVNGYFQ